MLKVSGDKLITKVHILMYDAAFFDAKIEIILLLCTVC